MNSIILFDGECGFCNRSVQFLLKRDKKRRFKFASIQSSIGQDLLNKYKIPPSLDSVILIEEKNYFIKSSAVIRIAFQLKGFWRLFILFTVIPVPIRNAFYDLIAKNRHRLQNSTHCQIPKREDLDRFL